MIVFDSDDMGCDREISGMCQSHDCRDILVALHEANPAFKATLFCIPGEMTMELLMWCVDRKNYIELAWHGFFHSSNYECEKMTYEQFSEQMKLFERFPGAFFAKGFKSPGWQISDDIYRWLKDNGWWVADQPFNRDRHPEGLKTYEIGENSIHTHTWNCCGNGVYELFPELLEKVKAETEFKFVSEVVS
jgi:hypothetical protein